MIIPLYWAEGRVRHRDSDRQVTMRRFGWSDACVEEAQAMADSRAEEALKRVLSGEKLPRREPRVPYNGAEGVPIREEIVDRQGDAVLTRNSYGALCLNTPDVFFIDVDFEDYRPFRFLTRGIYLVLVLVGVFIFWQDRAFLRLAIWALLSTSIATLLAKGIRRAHLVAMGGYERLAMKKIERFMAGRPRWNLRIYRTPAGLRLIATHRRFSPTEPEVTRCFEALGSDTIYRMMCLRQNCFRARVSPKPWRIGIGKYLRPNPGVWPVKTEYLPVREKWIAGYTEKSRGFASCSFLKSVGSGGTDEAVRPVVEWHDELSAAASGLPIA